MSTYRRELLHNKHLLCPPTAGNCFTTSISCVHLTLGMTEGSVLKRRSRHRAADCFHFMSTYRWELLLHVHLPQGMTEGSVLKSQSRHRAADCFHYISTYRWELLHNMSTYRWE
jgi:hypothetical protein